MGEGKSIGANCPTINRFAALIYFSCTNEHALKVECESLVILGTGE